MSMFREYGITLEEYKTMQRQTDEQNYMQYGFTLADLTDKMTDDGVSVNDFAFQKGVKYDIKNALKNVNKPYTVLLDGSDIQCRQKLLDIYGNGIKAIDYYANYDVYSIIDNGNNITINIR